VHAALLIGLAAAQADAGAPTSNRAVLEPLSGVQLSYERLGPDGSANPPGNFEGSLATPAGTLRTTMHAVPLGEQQFQRGDTSFEWTRVFGGQLQVRDLQAGGTAAAWRGRLDASLTAEAESEWTPLRSAKALRLNQNFGDGGVAKTLLSNSRTAAGQRSRGDFEIIQETGISRWNAGIDAAEKGYVSAGGGSESGIGVRLGAQWVFLPHSRMEARYTRQLSREAEEPACSVILGTRFDLPRGLSLATSVESAANDRKASLTLAVPLEIR
jgi:hypothetical protein